MDIRQIRRALVLAMLLILWPHATGLEPPLHLAGFELIMVVRPHGKVLPRGRTIEAILRDPLGR